MKLRVSALELRCLYTKREKFELISGGGGGGGGREGGVGRELRRGEGGGRKMVDNT